MHVIPHIRACHIGGELHFDSAHAAPLHVEHKPPQHKENQMSSTQTLADELSAMSASEKISLLNKLELSAFSENESKKVDMRIARVAAFAKVQPQMIREISARLSQIGLNLEAVIEGGKAAVDKATKAHAMDINDRFALTNHLISIGAL
jgi:hypothetical protein